MKRTYLGVLGSVCLIGLIAWLAFRGRTPVSAAAKSEGAQRGQVEAVVKIPRSAMVPANTRVASAGSSEDGDTTKPPASESQTKIAQLHDALNRLPGQLIPEMRFLKESDWYAAAEGPLETEDDYRIAFSKLRDAAENRFAADIQPAVIAYSLSNPGKSPAQGLRDFQPFYKGTLEDALIDRFTVQPSSAFPSFAMGGDWVLTPKELIDSKYDARILLGPRGFGSYKR